MRDGEGAGPCKAVGDLVAALVPVERPQRATLKGEVVSLVPLDWRAHAAALYEGSHGTESEHLWRYMSEGPYADFASFQESLRRKTDSIDPLFFTIVDCASGDAVGTAAYLRIDAANRVVEVGHILYLPTFQRTRGATEAMYLMARHVFEHLHYRRYEWKCNALNQASRQAALRLGFTFEGVFRKHMIVKGRNRDTAWFSMLDTEWPARKAAFEEWLDAANFDREGRQRRSLSDFNGLVRSK